MQDEAASTKRRYAMGGTQEENATKPGTQYPLIRTTGGAERLPSFCIYFGFIFTAFSRREKPRQGYHTAEAFLMAKNPPARGRRCGKMGKEAIA